jgi:nucleoside-diphosphate-sugar epimerase
MFALSARGRYPGGRPGGQDVLMRLLVLGGTAFLGRATAAHAVAAGHQVTCAARGISGAVADGATLVPVDRSVPDGLAPLAGQRFDAVIDVARVPSQIRRALDALAGTVGHWTFVSSCSAYADQKTPGQQAVSAPMLPAAPPELDDPYRSPETYGRCKVAGEEAVLGSGVPALICRAGLIVGPQDPSDRFTYWPVRLARGGPVLAPGGPEELVQYIDVRDLAAWLVHAAQTGLTGVYDGIGVPLARAEFLTAVAAGVGPPPDLVWVSQEFLLDHQVQPWSGPRSLPLWLPLPEYGGFLARDVTPALAAGLTVRPLPDTARDTLAWYVAAGSPPLTSGMNAADEAVVLEAWRTSHP